MEHLEVDKNIRLEALDNSIAELVFLTIQQERAYLSNWLPFVHSTQNLTDTEAFIYSITNQKTIKKDEVYSIWFKNNFAGLIGFKETDWINQKTELGYWLSEKMQGNGIATKCVEKLTRYAFQKLRLNRIQIKTAVGNSKSSAIPKRLCFSFEGIERAGEKHAGKFLDLEIYSLLKTEVKINLQP